MPRDMALSGTNTNDYANIPRARHESLGLSTAPGVPLAFTLTATDEHVRTAGQPASATMATDEVVITVDTHRRCLHQSPLAMFMQRPLNAGLKPDRRSRHGADFFTATGGFSWTPGDPDAGRHRWRKIRHQRSDGHPDLTATRRTLRCQRGMAFDASTAYGTDESRSP